jgi:hypothetical protein
MVDKPPSAGDEFNACAPIKEPLTNDEAKGRAFQQLGGALATASLIAQNPGVFAPAAGISATGFLMEHQAYTHSSFDHRQKEYLDQAGITNTDISQAYRSVHGANATMPTDLLDMARDPQTLKVLKSQASLHTSDAEWALNQFSKLETERLASTAAVTSGAPVQKPTTTP